MHTSPGCGEDLGWQVSELVSTLTFTESGAWLLEQWSIIAGAPLDELTLGLNLDGEHGVIDVQGAEFSPDQLARSASGRPVVGIWLPAPLAPGDRHDFCVSLTPSNPTALRRHVVVPTTACGQLSIRVQFRRPTGPRFVARIEAEDPAGETEGGSPIAVRPAGEITVTFQDLRPDKAYGVAWGW